MRKRMRVKVEIEFECPDKGEPTDAFFRYFGRATSKILYNKLVSFERFTIASNVDEKVRKLNEYKRVLKLALDQSEFKTYLSIKGTKGWNLNPHLSVQIVGQYYPYTKHLIGFDVDGQMLSTGSPKREFNLADPDSIKQITKLIDERVRSINVVSLKQHLDFCLDRLNKSKGK